MSGEDTSTSRNNNVVPYDYGDKKAESGKVPKFNGDPKEFTETMVKGLHFQKENLMKSVSKHVVNASRKG